MKASLFIYSLIGMASLAGAEPMDDDHAGRLRERIRTNFFIPSPLPTLNSTTHRRFAPAPGVTAEAVSYETQFGTRVPAILYLPNPLPSDRKLPGFIVVNGHGGDKHSWYAYYAGILYARAGAAVLTYDQAGEGERNSERRSGTRAHDKIDGGEILARRLCGLMITDVRQAVSYLAARPEVDATRIGAGGYSLGSFVLALAGAIEPRLRACVLVGGGNLDGPGGYWERSRKRMCQGLPYGSLEFLGDRAAVCYALNAARGATLVWNGRADDIVRMQSTQEPFFDDLRRRVVALRGSDAGVFTFGFTADAGHRPYFLTRPVALWLEQQLDLPHWSDASIRSLPTSHISKWSERNAPALEKLYATETHEGGTQALGADVPGYRYDDLHVFTSVEWQRVKSHFAFATWLAAARAAGVE